MYLTKRRLSPLSIGHAAFHNEVTPKITETLIPAQKEYVLRASEYGQLQYTCTFPHNNSPVSTLIRLVVPTRKVVVLKVAKYKEIQYYQYLHQLQLFSFQNIYHASWHYLHQASKPLFNAWLFIIFFSKLGFLANSIVLSVSSSFFTATVDQMTMCWCHQFDDPDKC